MSDKTLNPIAASDDVSSPKDTWNMSYVIFFLLGYSSLFPWHIFIKNPFFGQKFADTPYEASFSSWIARVFMVTNLLAMLVLTFQPKSLKVISNNSRLTMAYIGNVAIFLLTTFLPLFEGISGTAYFYIMLVCAGCCGFFVGIIQNTLFAVSSLFPKNFIQAVVSGQGLGGLASSAILITASIISGDSEKSTSEVATEAALYFGVSCIFIVCGLVGFLYMKRTSFFKYYESSSLVENKAAKAGEMQDGSDLLLSSPSSGIRTIFTRLPSAVYPFAVFFALFITLSAFPFIFSNVASVSESESFFFRKLFVPFGYLLFDVGDYIGKSLPGISLFYLDNDILALGSSFVRIFFIPLFMLCNFKDHPDFSSAPRLIQSDVVYFILCLLFGLTNGYSCSVVMMKAPQTVGWAIRDKMGMVMALFIGLGLAAGPFFSSVIGFFLN